MHSCFHLPGIINLNITLARPRNMSFVSFSFFLSFKSLLSSLGPCWGCWHLTPVPLRPHPACGLPTASFAFCTYKVRALGVGASVSAPFLSLLMPTPLLCPFTASLMTPQKGHDWPLEDLLLGEESCVVSRAWPSFGSVEKGPPPPRMGRGL